MAEYEELVETIEVPKNTGIKGFLRVVEDILKKPRVQSIEIDSRGKISFKYYVRKGAEHTPLKTDLETLTPYMVIRNGETYELPEPSRYGPIAVGQLFDQAAVDHLFPVAFVGGKQTHFWRWYESTSEKSALSSREWLFGLPFLLDRHIPDEVLILTAAFTREAALIDVQKSYKIVIPTEDS